MKPFVLVLTAALATVGCTSSTTPTAPSSAAAADAASRAALPTITGIAVGNADFTTLVAALGKADLVATFDGDRHFTVFAPTNAAFDAAAVALLGAGNTGPDLVAALDVDTLSAVLAYHVTRGDRHAQSVVAAGSVRMLDGNTATISVVGSQARIDNANIVATDIRASNGLVHVIDAVILPPSLP